MSQVLTLTFLLSSIGIIVGYGLVAVYVAPHLKSTTSNLTKVGGVFFFMLCGLGTHFEMAIHAMTDSTIDASSWHMTLIHLPQLASIIAFAAGLHNDHLIPSIGIIGGALTWVANNKTVATVVNVINRRLPLYVSSYMTLLLTVGLLELHR